MCDMYPSNNAMLGVFVRHFPWWSDGCKR